MTTLSNLLASLDSVNADVSSHRFSESYMSKTPWHVTIKTEREGVKVEVSTKAADFETALTEAWVKFSGIINHGSKKLLAPVISEPKAITVNDEVPF